MCVIFLIRARFYVLSCFSLLLQLKQTAVSLTNNCLELINNIIRFHFEMI